MKSFLLSTTLVVLQLCLHQQYAHALIKEYAPLVETKQGKVIGLVQEFEDEKVHFYQGIRYGHAERFAKPTPAPAWSGTLNATTYQFACPQGAYKRSPTVDLSKGFETGSSNEDCLFLNVWRPASNSTKPRPVMVWIHGGSFEFGTIFSMIYDGRVIASMGDVVVVTVNYRLGALGFLYGGLEEEGEWPGNQGLYDQILALKWVQENIGAFGGDAEQVTVMGESAGSMSVGALVLSPLTKGLFKRAITQSGAPNSYLGSEDKTKQLAKAKSISAKLDCTQTDAKQLLACMRTKSVDAILEATKDSLANAEATIPVWGDQVLPIRPVEALKSGKFNHVDLMFGVNRNEGSSFVANILPFLDPDTDGSELHVEQVRSMIQLMMLLFKEDTIAQEVVDFYTKNLNDSDKTQLRIAVSDAFGDYHLVCPTVLFGEQFAKLTPTPTNRHYAYRLMRPTSIQILGCHGWMGVCHAEDVVYMFGIPARIRGLLFSEEEYQLSVDMIRAWTSFAHTGSPGKMGGGGVEWTEALPQSHETTGVVQHMYLDANAYKMVDGFFVPQCDTFWKPKLFV